jgi:hypothetical protein
MKNSILTIPPSLTRNYTEVLPLRLRALPHAPRHTTLELMWTSNAFVSVFQYDGERDGVAYTVAAPWRRNAELKSRTFGWMKEKRYKKRCTMRACRKKLGTNKSNVQLVPTQLLTVLNALPYACPLSNPALWSSVHTHIF